MPALRDFVPLIVIVALALGVFAVLVGYLKDLALAISGTITAVSVSTVFAVLENLDRSQKFVAWAQRGFSWLGGRLERGAVSNRIRGSIGEASKLINKEGGALLPFGMKIDWVRPEKVERDAFVKENNVIVVLEHHRNDGRNLARAVSLYVSEGLIPTSRVYVDQVVMKSADLAVGRKILMLNNRMDAVKCFNEEFVQPAAVDTRVKWNLTAMENLDSEGQFTRVLMREFSELWAKLYPRPPSRDIHRDTIGFLQLLDRLLNKEEWEKVPLVLEGGGIKVAILPVARQELRGGDIEPYLRAVEINYSKGIESIYLVARGKVNLTMSQMLVSEIQRKGLYVVDNASEYTTKLKDGKKVAVYICLLRIKKS